MQEAENENVLYRKKVINHPDGTTQIIYEAQPETGKLSTRDHLTVIYLVIASVALAISGYVSYRQLKK